MSRLAAFPNTLPTPSQLLQHYRTSLRIQVANGAIRPLLRPSFAIAYALLFSYLLIPHVDGDGRLTRPLLYKARYFVFALICWLNWNTLFSNGGERTLAGGTGFVVGLMSVWTTLWSAVWLLFTDPQREAWRIERDGVGGGHTAQWARLDSDTTAVAIDPSSISNGGSVKRRSLRSDYAVQDSPQQDMKYQKSPLASKFYRQTYPLHSLSARIDWVQDLLFNFKGPGWSWEVSSQPGPPPDVAAAVGLPIRSFTRSGITSAGIRRFDTRTALCKHVLPRFVLGYFLLDAAKVILMKDPYFLVGPNSYPLPYYLENLTAVQLAFYRRIASFTAVVIALQTIFMASPLFLGVILGPRHLGLRGESWYYASAWGGFSAIKEKGLAGLWGGWWHQTFRHGFEAPTAFLISRGYLKKGSTAARFTGVVVAFGVSAALHSAGSYTMFSNTNPIHPALFFGAQAVGVLLERGLHTLFAPLAAKMPRWSRSLGNIAFALLWLYGTSAWLVDDFARGIWLFEPVPFSVLRGMGYGHPDEGWFCPNDMLNLYYHDGGSWWRSGWTV